MSRNAMKSTVLRRSVALPQSLVKLAQSYLPPEKRSNLNGLMRQALENFVRQHRYEEFRKSVQSLAQDPKFLEEQRRFMDETTYLDEDGLK